MKIEWADTVSKCCIPKPPKPFDKVKLTITYFFPTRTRHDPDNYNGVFILDGLVKCGIIRDDSFDCIDLILRGGYDKLKPRTEIEITEVT